MTLSSAFVSGGKEEVILFLQVYSLWLLQNTRDDQTTLNILYILSELLTAGELSSDEHDFRALNNIYSLFFSTYLGGLV